MPPRAGKLKVLPSGTGWGLEKVVLKPSSERGTEEIGDHRRDCSDKIIQAGTNRMTVVVRTNRIRWSPGILGPENLQLLWVTGGKARDAPSRTPACPGQPGLRNKKGLRIFNVSFASFSEEVLTF